MITNMLGNAGSNSVTSDFSLLNSSSSDFEMVNKSEINKSSSFSMLESEGGSVKGCAFSAKDVQEDLTKNESAFDPTYNVKSFVICFQEQMEEAIKSLDEEIEIKDGIVKLWHDVVKDKKAKGESSNEKNRIPFVRLQAVIEGVISSFLGDGKISAVGTIHTPTPPNPLKTKVITHSSASEEEMKNVNLGKGLMNEQIAGNPQCKKTVTERAKIIRECLDNGMVLFAAYQTDKDEEEMSNFNSCLKQYENLHKRKLATFDPKFSGATYIFGDKESTLMFSLSASQVNSEQTKMQKWRFWFGEMDLSTVQGIETHKNIDKEKKTERRFVKVSSLLQAHGNINMIEKYKQKVSTSLEQVQVEQTFKDSALNVA